MQGTNNLLQVRRLPVSISNECPTPRGRTIPSIGTKLWHARLIGGPPKLHEHVPTRRQLTRHNNFSAKYPKTNLTLGHINACLQQGQRLTSNEQRSRTTNEVHPGLNPVIINENMNEYHRIGQLGITTAKRKVHGTTFLHQLLTSLLILEGKPLITSGGIKEGPYQDRPPLCPFRLLPLLIYSGSMIAFLKFEGP